MRGTRVRRQQMDAIASINQMRDRARRLPRPLFDTIDGGAGDEIALRENRMAYQRIGIRPRALADVAGLDTSTTVFGQRLSMPLMLAPVGGILRMHRAGELGVARAAAGAGTSYIAHQAPGYPLEVLTSAAPGLIWSQMYLPPDRAVTQAAMDRLVRAGCNVLCVTIDAAVAPRTRERDFRNRLANPASPYPSHRALMRAGLTNPWWATNMVRGLRATRQLYSDARPRPGNYAHAKPVTFDDVAWLRDRWDGHLVIKGVQRGDECGRMVDLGVDGLVVSNHGARYLDTGRATIDILPEVVDAVDGRAEVFIDGGIRRGTDVLKALALGAKAVLIGKAYVYGLAAGGEAGVERVLEIFRSEIGEAMALSGCVTVADIDRGLVTWRARTCG